MRTEIYFLILALKGRNMIARGEALGSKGKQFSKPCKGGIFNLKDVTYTVVFPIARGIQGMSLTTNSLSAGGKPPSPSPQSPHPFLSL